MPLLPYGDESSPFETLPRLPSLARFYDTFLGESGRQRITAAKPARFRGGRKPVGGLVTNVPSYPARSFPLAPPDGACLALGLRSVEFAPS